MRHNKKKVRPSRHMWLVYERAERLRQRKSSSCRFHARRAAPASSRSPRRKRGARGARESGCIGHTGASYLRQISRLNPRPAVAMQCGINATGTVDGRPRSPRRRARNEVCAQHKRSQAHLGAAVRRDTLKKLLPHATLGTTCAHAARPPSGSGAGAAM